MYLFIANPNNLSSFDKTFLKNSKAVLIINILRNIDWVVSSKYISILQSIDKQIGISLLRSAQRFYPLQIEICNIALR